MALLFTVLPDFARLGDFVASGREDDVAHDALMVGTGVGVFVIVHQPFFVGIAARGARLRLFLALGLMERTTLQVQLAGPQQPVHGVGRLCVDAAVVERAQHEEAVGLDGSPVLRVGEGQRPMQPVVFDRQNRFRNGALHHLMMTAIEGAPNGGLGATAS